MADGAVDEKVALVEKVDDKILIVDHWPSGRHPRGAGTIPDSFLHSGAFPTALLLGRIARKSKDAQDGRPRCCGSIRLFDRPREEHRSDGGLKKLTNWTDGITLSSRWQHLQPTIGVQGGCVPFPNVGRNPANQLIKSIEYATFELADGSRPLAGVDMGGHKSARLIARPVD